MGKSLIHDDTLLLHVDGGANVHICTDHHIFTCYKTISMGVQQVTGTKAKCIGIGIVLILLMDSDITIPLYLVYHMPSNPQNTLGPPALMFYNSFRKITVQTLHYVYFITSEDLKHCVYTEKDLESTKLMYYIQVQVISPFQSIPSICNATTQTSFVSTDKLDRTLIHRRLMHI